VFPATVGELCSLLPVHGEALGIRTSGLRWPLHGDGDRLEAGTSRGVSNEATATEVSVHLDEGTLAVVFPGAFP
jgi:thiamine pyrophosphokinase